MPYTTLIPTSDLAACLADPALCTVDCRFALEDPDAGGRAYLDGHIPGAIYAHLDRDLSGEKTGTNGRHPLPSPRALVHTFSRFGIDRATQVVAYGAQTDMFPARLWWLLRWLGHEAVAVLDGGIDKWMAEGRALVSGVETRAPRAFTGTPRADMVVGADAVETLRGDRDWRLVDARAPERYRGDIEPIDSAAGHIPGAINLPFKDSIGADGALRAPTDLRRVFEGALAGVAPDHVVCYCGSGVSACHDVLALEHSGLHGAKLYPGSWSEWSSDPARPIETGGPKG